MRKSGIISLFCLFAFATMLLLTACGGSVEVSPASKDPSIKSAVMSRGYKDQQAVNVTKVFKPEDHIFHTVINLNNPTAGTKVRTVYIAVDAEGAKNQEIVQVEYQVKTVEDIVHASAELPNDWPVGTYKADIYLNDKLDRSLDFSVK